MPVKTLMRDANAANLMRLENAARTLGDFQDLVGMYDKLDENRERRERYNEVGMGEYRFLDTRIARSGRGKDPEQKEADRKNGYSGGAVIPPPLAHPYWRELTRGDFISFIFDNPYEMWQVIGDWQVASQLPSLTDKQKEAFFYRAVRLCTTEQIACYTDRTDRAVRRLIETALERIHEGLASAIRSRLDAELPVTLEKVRFLAWYDKQPKKPARKPGRPKKGETRE